MQCLDITKRNVETVPPPTRARLRRTGCETQTWARSRGGGGDAVRHVGSRSAGLAAVRACWPPRLACRTTRDDRRRSGRRTVGGTGCMARLRRPVGASRIAAKARARARPRGRRFRFPIRWPRAHTKAGGAHPSSDLGLPDRDGRHEGRLGAGILPVPSLGGRRRPHVRGRRFVEPAHSLRGWSWRAHADPRRCGRSPACERQATRVRAPWPPDAAGDAEGLRPPFGELARDRQVFYATPRARPHGRAVRRTR